MEYYGGIDVSLESASVCVVDASGRVVRETKVASEPEALIAWFGRLGVEMTRIGLEAGPLSQWLHAGMREAGLAVELLETRHVPDAFKAMPVKTDRRVCKVVGTSRCGRDWARVFRRTKVGTEPPKWPLRGGVKCDASVKEGLHGPSPHDFACSQAFLQSAFELVADALDAIRVYADQTKEWINGA